MHLQASTLTRRCSTSLPFSPRLYRQFRDLCFTMTGPALSSIPEQADGLLTHTLGTALHIVSVSASAVLGFFPPFIANIVTSLLGSAQHLLAVHWEARVVALCLMLPSLAVLAVVLSTAIAVLWPFSFLVGTVGGLCAAAAYLFWPSSTDLKTCLVSAVFALAAQLLLVLPVYFLSPPALFALLLATSAYLFVSRSWLLLLGTSWWLLTTPYWALIHYVTFPFLFTASFLVQLGCSIAGLVLLAVYPALPALLSSHYSAFVEQRSFHSNGQSHSYSTAGNEQQHGNSDWLKTEYGTSKRRDDEYVKEESKTHE